MAELDFSNNADVVLDFSSGAELVEGPGILQEKEQSIQALQARSRAGEITPVTSGIAQAGEVASIPIEAGISAFRRGEEARPPSVVDIPIAGAKAVGGAIADVAGGVAGSIAETELAEKAIEAFQISGQGINKFKQDNPAFARVLEESGIIAKGLFGVAEGLGAGKLAKVAGKEALDFGSEIVESTTQRIAEKATLKGAERKLKKTGQFITAENISPDDALTSAVEAVQEVYSQRKNIENLKWEAAKEKGDVKIDSRFLSGLDDQIEKTIKGEDLTSLRNESIKPLVQVLDTISEQSFININGELLSKNLSIADILPMRRGISKLATSKDSSLRRASGNALAIFDERLKQTAMATIRSGDDDAINSMLDAIGESKEIFQAFGTSRAKGQKPLFEQLITKEAVDNSQIVAAFGTTPKGTTQVQQFVTRLLDNSGDQREFVRKNLADGYIYRAVISSDNNPKKLIENIDKLLIRDRAVGGLGKDLRGLVFSDEDVKKLAFLKKGLQNRKFLRSSVRSFASKTPLLRNAVRTPDETAKAITKKQVDKMLNGLTESVKPKKGEAFNYGQFIN